MPMIRTSGVPSVEIPAVVPFKPARPVGPIPRAANDKFFAAARADAQAMPWARFAKKYLPLYAAIGTADLLLQYWSQQHSELTKVPGEWTKVLDCPAPAFPVGPGNQPSSTCWAANAFPTWYGSYITPLDTFKTVRINAYWDVGYSPLDTTQGLPSPPYVGSVYGLRRYTRPARAVNDPLAYQLPVYWTPPALNPQVDPNWVRDMPGELPQPVPGEAPGNSPIQSPDNSPGTSVPPWTSYPGQPQPGSNPGTSPSTPPTVAVPPNIDPGPSPSEWQWVSPDVGGFVPLAPHIRRPPRKGEKERKVKNKSQRLGKAIYDAVDYISEKAEIVDAIYDALPEDVKKRWEKGRKTKGRGMADQAGQYGIDGADWKSQAIWHNWEKIDMEVAFRNIVKNHVEDAVIGRGQKYLPKNVGSAFDRDLPGDMSWSPEQQVSSWVDDLFNAVW